MKANWVFMLTAAATASLVACRQGPAVAVEWPASVGIEPDSLSRIYAYYLGRSPRSLVGCGSRHIAVGYDRLPGDLLHSGATENTTDAGVTRAEVGAATTVALLAWNAVERSHAVDTITVAVTHPDGSRNQFTFARADEPTPLQPLRYVESLGMVCALPI